MRQTILRWPVVKASTGLSRVSVWRMEKAGKFPHRVQIGVNSVGWLESEIQEWIQNRHRVEVKHG